MRSLQDTVYNMNLAHLSRGRRTVFEHLADGGIRSACTTYLIYRGRTRHSAAEGGLYPTIARATGPQFRHAVWGPDELFYADLFASRKTDCRSALGMPGQRDQHTGCVGAYLVENDLCDFMLASLPDNDTYSHKRGPYAQVTSIASADRALERIMHAAGGPDPFLDDYAVIVMSDHSQTAVADPINLAEVLGSWDVLLPDQDPAAAEVAVCPSQRSAQVYVLDPERRQELAPRVVRDLRRVEGLDAIARLDGAEAVVWTPRGEIKVRAGRRSLRRSRRPLERRGRAGRPRPRDRGRTRSKPLASACAGAAVDSGSGAPARATCSSPRRPATSSWTGAEWRTSEAGATARCFAATHSAR